MALTTATATMTDAEVDALADELRNGSPLGVRLESADLTVPQTMAIIDAIVVSGEPTQRVCVGRITPPADAPPFFDPRNPLKSPPIVLDRNVADGNERFLLRERVAYWEEDLGAIIVPADLGAFRSDLTSVPQLLTWLVPRTGEHLPSALVHDGLVLGADEPRTHIGPDVSRTDADRIFRDGMGELGTGFLRRWMMWATVALATAWADGPVMGRAAWRAVIALTITVVAVLGGLATVDLFDCRRAVPWMGDLPLLAELASGALFAIVIPSALAVGLWWGRRWAGFIVGVVLSLLLHVTLALTVLLCAYVLAEDLLRQKFAWKRTGLAVAGLVSAGLIPVVFVAAAC